MSGARAHIGTDSGEVAQIARTLLPYWRGAGIDVRWMVLRGSVEFFRVTKRFTIICKASQAIQTSSG